MNQLGIPINDQAAVVAINLLKSPQQEDAVRINVACAWISSRLPHGHEVDARDNVGRIGMEFVEAQSVMVIVTPGFIDPQ